MAITPTTSLEAVNQMLATVGQAPINTLPSEAGGASPLVDAVVAENTLNEVTRKVQQEGWDFNTDYEYPIAPNGSNNLVPPSNTLKIKVSKIHCWYDLVLRQSKMWDRKNLTFTITDTVKFDIVFGYDFEELPESLRQYIAIRASRIFQDRVLGSDTLHSYSEDDEIHARADWESDDNQTAKYSIFDDAATAETIRRF